MEVQAERWSEMRTQVKILMIGTEFVGSRKGEQSFTGSLPYTTFDTVVNSNEMQMIEEARDKEHLNTKLLCLNTTAKGQTTTTNLDRHKKNRKVGDKTLKLNVRQNTAKQEKLDLQICSLTRKLSLRLISAVIRIVM